MSHWQDNEVAVSKKEADKKYCSLTRAQVRLEAKKYGDSISRVEYSRLVAHEDVSAVFKCWIR